MPSILPFLKPHDGSFGPDITRIMGEAYDAARKQLHSAGQPDIIYEIIAQRIIAAAKAGERDPHKLCESALRGIGPPR